MTESPKWIQRLKYFLGFNEKFHASEGGEKMPVKMAIFSQAKVNALTLLRFTDSPYR